MNYLKNIYVHKSLLILITLCLLGSFSWDLSAQQIEITPGNDTALCAGIPYNLVATIDPTSDAGGSTAFAGYDFENIPIAPGPTVGTNIPLGDDGTSNAINIGFPFEYFGAPYNQLYVSPNGYIGFDPPLPGNFQPEELPSCDADVPNLAIVACWEDFNPGAGGSVTYTTTGVAPNRRFVVSWNNVPFFGGNCGGQTSSFQIHLYETTNVIEIHITNKPACASMWTGVSVTGLIGANSGTNCNCGYIEDAYNGNTVSFNNDAFRYTPLEGTVGGDATLESVQWTLNGANVGSANSLTYTAFMLPNFIDRTVIVTAVFSIPCIGNISVRDTVVISGTGYDPTFSITSPICAGQETSLITYVGSPAPSAAATFNWDFDGGVANPGNGIGPHDVSWATPGDKNVSLTISGGNCEAASFDTIVEVVPSPTSTFTTTNEVCGSAPATITYTGNAPGSANYTWDFDGGVAVPANGQGPFSVTWATPGLKTISLSVGIGSCVSNETTVQVNVLPAPASTFVVSSPSVCAEDDITVTFTGTSPASAIYTWNFDGGTAVPANGQGPFTVSWATGGAKNITLQVNDNGCISAITTVPVTVNAIPTADFTATQDVCPNANATITYTGSASAGAAYNWSWDSGTAAPGNGIGPHTVNWATPGVKNLSLTVTENGCVSDAFNANVTVNQIPTSTFTATPAGVCVGANTGISYTGNASAAATYNWNFNGGTALPGGTSQGPHQLSWSTQGMKTVSLTVSENGCVSTPTTVNVEVYETPTANFNITPAVCPGAPANVNYIGTGTAAATYTWNFDGGNSTPVPGGSGPYTVIWNTSGSKTVSLVVAENGCASQAFTQDITIYNVPSSAFTANSPICAGESTTVSYIGDAGAGANYSWDFLAGSPANAVGQGPHDITYNLDGTYFLNLTVTENGCESSPTQVQVVVNPIPTTDFVVGESVCLDDYAEVVYNGTAPANSIFNWDFGSGNATSTNGPGPILVGWDTPGPKPISLSVNSLGCQSVGSTELIVNVLPLPEVDAGVDIEVCSGAVSDIGGPALPGYTYSWSPILGLNDPLASSTSVQLMNNTLNTIVREYILTANDGSCEAQDTMLYSVTAPPFVSFAAPPGQCFDGHAFSFVAEGAFTPTAEFIWNFGPNAVTPSSSVVNPTNISFDTTGSQTITLQVNDGGCFSNLYSADVVIYKEPEADFYSENISGCAPLEVKFVNISEGPSNMQYEWNFGVGQISASEKPSYEYSDPGVYDVSLSVITQNGCSSSFDRKEYINVYPTPVASFKPSAILASIIDPRITFTSDSDFADSTWFVIQAPDTNYFQDSLIIADTVTFIFPDTGIYQISHYADNMFGCLDSAESSISIITGYRIYVPNSFSPNNDGTNDFFKAYGEGIETYEITVWNRWGQQVYRSFDIENGWDGKARLTDEFVPSGVYLYRMDIVDKRGYSHSLEGVVNVIN